MSKPSVKRLFYFTPYDILRSRTNQISDVRFCEGFAQNGYEVTLVAPYVYRKDNVKKKEILDTYGVQNKFKVVYLPTPYTSNVEGNLKLSFVILLNTLYFLGIKIKQLFNKKDSYLIISRSAPILYPMVKLKTWLGLSHLKMICWVHEIKKYSFYKFVYCNVNFVWGTNSAIKNDIKKFYAIPDRRLGVTLNPVTETQVKSKISKDKAREEIGITDEKLVVYTGKLSTKQDEIKYILKAAKSLPQYTFLFTGGKPDVLVFYKKWCKENNVDNTRFTGYLHDYRKLRYYQNAADVLVSFYTSSQHNLRYNLPQKIVEYMLTGNPVVTPKFEATDDILTHDNAIFVEEEDVESLKMGIVEAMENRTNSEQLGRNAQKLADTLTFKKIIAGLIANNSIHDS